MKSPILLNGKAISEKIRNSISEELKKIDPNGSSPPTLATILVGDDPASATYVNMKRKACASVGMLSRFISLPKSTTTEQLLAEIEKLNLERTKKRITLYCYILLVYMY